MKQYINIPVHQTLEECTNQTSFDLMAMRARGVEASNVVYDDWVMTTDVYPLIFPLLEEYAADMSVLRSDDVAQTLADYARAHNAQLIIFGQSPDAARPGNIIDRVRQMLADTGAAIAVQARTND